MESSAVPFRVRSCCEIVDPRQSGIGGYHRHHASCCHEQALHVDAAIFIPQDVHHRLRSDVTFDGLNQNGHKQREKPCNFFSSCVSIPRSEVQTVVLLQQLLPLAVSAPRGFYSGRGRKGVDGGEVERSGSIPPALASRIFPHFRMFFVDLSRYAVLVGDVAIST